MHVAESGDRVKKGLRFEKHEPELQGRHITAGRIGAAVPLGLDFAFVAYPGLRPGLNSSASLRDS